MKVFIFALVIVCFSFTHIASTQAKNKTFKVGVSDQSHFPLFDFSQVKQSGFAYDVLELFAQLHDIQFIYVPMNSVQLQLAIEKEEIDFIFPDNPNWKLYRYTSEPNIFSLPMIHAISSTFVREADAKITVDQVESVAIPYGYSALTWYNSLQKFSIETMTTPSLEASINGLYRGKVTAADLEYNVANHLSSLFPGQVTLTINKNLPSSPVTYHLSTVKHILVIEQFSHFLTKHADQIENIRKSYGIKSYQEVFGNDGKDTYLFWTQ